MQKIIQKPDLKTYLNIHHYLEDLYKHRKSTETDFSYELWAIELNIENRNYLRQLVVGRRSLKEPLARQMCERLNFKGIEAEYFMTLIYYSNAKSQSERNIHGIRLTQILRQEAPKDHVKMYQEFVSNPLYPKIQTVLSFKDIAKVTNSIAKVLNITEGQAEEALQFLESIGLAEKNSDHSWTALNRSFTIEDDIGNSSLLSYHEKSLQEAIRATALPKNERRYHSIIVPLSQDDFDSFNEDLRRFALEMRSKYDSDNLNGKKLFQANLNFYSISEGPAQPSL